MCSIFLLHMFSQENLLTMIEYQRCQSGSVSINPFESLERCTVEYGNRIESVQEKKGANRCYCVSEQEIRGFLWIYLETVTFKVRDNSKWGIILSSFWCYGFCKAQIDQLKPVSFLLNNTRVISYYQMKRKREKSTTDSYIFPQFSIGW